MESLISFSWIIFSSECRFIEDILKQSWGDIIHHIHHHSHLIHCRHLHHHRHRHHHHNRHDHCHYHLHRHHRYYLYQLIVHQSLTSEATLHFIFLLYYLHLNWSKNLVGRRPMSYTMNAIVQYLAIDFEIEVVAAATMCFQGTAYRI